MCDISDIVVQQDFLLPVGLGLIFYLLIEFLLHHEISRIYGIRETTKFPYLWVISIGFAFAKKYKGESKGEDRKNFVKKCNILNLIISFVLMIFSFLVTNISQFWGLLFLGINTWRFLSRSVEIFVAFGFDCFDKKQKSNLNKFERLKLAILSYFEIYMFSSSIYFSILSLSIYIPLFGMYSTIAESHHNISKVVESIVMSLSVGTLTNVAYSQENLFFWFKLFPFIQVFCTLSLVVLSLTMYVSRNEPSSQWRNL